MEHNIDTKNCWQCRYFARHYSKLKGRYFEVTGCGHCVNSEVTKGEKKRRFDGKEECVLWEPIEIQKEERKENLKKTLSKMAKKIEEILQVLKDDE